MLSLPLDLEPDKVATTRLPAYLIGKLKSLAGVYLDTVQLTDTPLPVQLELTYSNRPYYQARKSCTLLYKGFDSIWAFYAATNTGTTRFVIPKGHGFWQSLGEIKEHLLISSSSYWRIIDIKESGDLKQVKTVTLVIVEAGSYNKTVLSNVAIGVARGRSLYDLLFFVASGNSGVYDHATAPAMAYQGDNNYSVNAAKARGSIPVFAKISEFYQDSVRTAVAAAGTDSYDVAVKVADAPLRKTSSSISDGYEYNYAVAIAFSIQN